MVIQDISVIVMQIKKNKITWKLIISYEYY